MEDVDSNWNKTEGGGIMTPDSPWVHYVEAIYLYTYPSLSGHESTLHPCLNESKHRMN